MISIKKIGLLSPFYDDVVSTLNDSFPLDERRNKKDFSFLLEKNKSFSVNVILYNNESIGLINFWIFNRFIYIEHFAIKQKYRGLGFGTFVMQNLFVNYNNAESSSKCENIKNNQRKHS